MTIGRPRTTRSLIFAFGDDFRLIRLRQAERNQFIERLQRFALSRRIRISFLSGDVHCAAVGVFKTIKSRRSPALAAALDHRYMLNVVTSAFQCQYFSVYMSVMTRGPHVQVRLSTLRKLLLCAPPHLVFCVYKYAL